MIGTINRLTPASLFTDAVGISGSNIGSPALLEEMLQFAAKHDVKPWIQKYDMDNINQAMPDFEAGKPRYRFVLVNTDNGGKM
jgi:alcohol dehydrogenase (NADP+)